MGGENTFFDDVYDLSQAKEKLAPIIDKVWRHAEAKALYGRTLTLKVKYSDFAIITRSRTVPHPLRTRAEVVAVAYALLEPVFPVIERIRLLGVSLSGFADRSEPTDDLEQFSFAL